LGLMSIAPLPRNRFSTSLLPQEKPESVRHLSGKCGMTASGRLFWVLPGGDGRVLNIGKVREGLLVPPKGPAATKRLVRKRTRRLIPYSGPFIPDITGFDEVWMHRGDRGQAVLLARVQPRPEDDETLVYYAREGAGQLKGFRIRTEGNFRKRYIRSRHADLSL